MLNPLDCLFAAKTKSHWYALLSFTLAAALPAAAHTQINRCTDPHSGQVQYTDAKCPQGQTSQQIEAAKTPQEVEQARIANEQRKEQEERLRQAQARENALKTELAEQEKINQMLTKDMQARTNMATSTIDYSHSAACKNAQKAVAQATPDHGRFTRESRQALQAAQDNADRHCMSPEAYAHLVQQRAQQQQPIVVVQPSYYYPYPRPPRPPHTPHLPTPAPAPPHLLPYYPYSDQPSWGINIQLGGSKR